MMESIQQTEFARGSSMVHRYQKLECAGQGVIKTCEHVGRGSPKARDHLEHKVRDIRGTRITKKGTRSYEERNLRDTTKRTTKSSRGTRNT